MTNSSPSPTTLTINHLIFDPQLHIPSLGVGYCYCISPPSGRHGGIPAPRALPLSGWEEDANGIERIGVATSWEGSSKHHNCEGRNPWGTPRWQWKASNLHAISKKQQLAATWYYFWKIPAAQMRSCIILALERSNERRWFWTESSCNTPPCLHARPPFEPINMSNLSS